MKYRDGYQYQLSETFITQISISPAETVAADYIILTPEGRLSIIKGYCWDGATWAWDSMNSMRGSLVHDALYALLRQRKLSPDWRIVADEELESLLKLDGMWWPRRKAWMTAVRLFGGSAADPANKKPVLTAP